MSTFEPMIIDGFTDREVQYFADYPEPPEVPSEEIELGALTSNIKDTYLQQLEQYIHALSKQARAVQTREGELYSEFQSQLDDLKKEDAGPARTRAERDHAAAFDKSVKTVRSQRTQYRRMLADALTQRSHLLDSMLMKRKMDDLVRTQLYQLRALPDHESPEIGNFRVSPFSVILAVEQILMIILFAVVVTFPTFNPAATTSVGAQSMFAYYTDIALFALIGFGFLASFLRKYSYSSLGYTLMLFAFSVQWAVAVVAFFRQSHLGAYSKILLSLPTLIDGLYGAIAVIISFGAIAGKLSPLGMLLMGFVEIIVYGLNLFIGEMLLSGEDFGGSIYVHTFGAFFGLAVSVGLSKHYMEDTGGKSMNETHSYSSDAFALLGTLILWVFFPSVNASFAPGATQSRAAVNTVMSLCGGTVFAFLVSRTFRQRKFSVSDIQTATIAGGVAISSTAAVVVTPGVALLLGALGSSIAVVTTTFVTPWLISAKSRVKIHDTRGVLGVHGFPGVMAALAGIIATAITTSYDENLFGQSFDAVFKAGNTSAGYQAAALIITLLFSIVLGLAVGILLGWVEKRKEFLWFSDEQFWNLPSDFEGTKKLTKVTHVVQ